VDRGVGLDARLGLGVADLRDLVQDAKALGYTSAWTPSSTDDPFELCAMWWETARVATGIAVMPVTTPAHADALSRSAVRVAARTGGRFVLGIGSGAPDPGAFERTRVALGTIRGALRGDPPVYLAALGPRMLALAGAQADGVALNWCTTEHVAWSRARVERAATRAGRDPGSVPIVEYIRVCVDDDADAARLAIARQVLGYALGREGQPKTVGYRAHFARMGFGEILDELEARRDRGAGIDAIARHAPEAMLRAVAAYGAPAAVREGFARLAVGLDVAIVRVITTQASAAAARATIVACRPEL
jgi:alkanesulfonate monooxygenase SsuD/methylene tetrahydromethanopterin reductase-like flavin-dependent oxidoreductase (luciferase family)